MKSLFAILLLAGVASGQDTGSLRGFVRDEAGKPVAGADVAADRVRTLPAPGTTPRTSAPSNPVSRVATTAADGSFVIEQLPPGAYSLCATGSDPRQISSCRWGRKTEIVSVTTGEATSPDLIVRNGSLLTVTLKDPKAKLAPGSRVLIGVVSPEGYYSRAAATTGPNKARVFTVAVPRRQSLRLFFDAEVPIIDGSGNYVPLKQPGTVMNSGQSDLALEYSVN